MLTVTLACNAQSGWIGACSEPGSGQPAASGSFANSPQLAATSAIEAWFNESAERAERARDWAALQARMPIDERVREGVAIG